MQDSCIMLGGIMTLLLSLLGVKYGLRRCVWAPYLQDVCQLDWAMTCPNIWLNFILDVSMRVFLGEINI